MKINQEDSFYRNWNAHYFKHEDNIVGITSQRRIFDTSQRRIFDTSYDIFMNAYHIKTKQFTPTIKLTYVNYNDLKQVDYLYDHVDYAIVIDVDEEQWSKTSRFPYYISEIDGNYICCCKKENQYFIFHSHTEQYETGVFIFDIKTNTYNDKDFDITKDYITNRFTHLHEKDIISCDPNQLLINNDGSIETYDPNTNMSMTLLTSTSNADIKLYNDLLYEQDGNNIHIYDIEKNLIKSIKVCEANQFILYWDSDLVMYENHRNPLDTSHENYLKSRELTIKSIIN